MGIFSIILIVIWALMIVEGIYGLVKGYFFHEQEKVKKHEPNAYHKWIRLSSVLIIICGVLCVLWSFLDGFSKATDFKYIIFIIITVVVIIAAIAVAYRCIVKPADKAIGIESEIDKILKEDKENKH